MLAAAWIALHVLLVAAAMVAALPWPAFAPVAIAVAVHAFRCRPELVPAVLALTADGTWLVAGYGLRPFVPGPRTLLAPYWLRLDLRSRGARLSIVLCRDQVDDWTWRRLSARLRRGESSRSEPARSI